MVADHDIFQLDTAKYGNGYFFNIDVGFIFFVKFFCYVLSNFSLDDGKWKQNAKYQQKQDQSENGSKYYFSKSFDTPVILILIWQTVYRTFSKKWLILAWL